MSGGYLFWLGASAEEADPALVASDQAAARLAPAGVDPLRIPAGPYCYASHGPMNEHGIIKLNGMCPYWERRKDGHAFCQFVGGEDEFGLLADQVKICGQNDDWGDA